MNKILNKIPTFLIPQEINEYNRNKVIYPFASDLARSLLPIISKSKSKVFTGRANVENWISLDSSYNKCITMRKNLLKTNGDNIIQYKNISESACRETFKYILAFILKKYPYVFNIKCYNGKSYLCNKITKSNYRIDDLLTCNPTRLLKIICNSIQEDINIIQKIGEEYCLTATLTTCPVGWDPKERIGETMEILHRDAPGWERGKGAYAKGITSSLDKIVVGEAIVKRANLFIFNTDKHFILEYNPSIPSAADIGNKAGFRYIDLYLRREYQTFIRLPESYAILFTVKTYMEPIIDLSLPELIEIQELVSDWKPSQINYHFRDSWLPVLNKYILERQK